MSLINAWLEKLFGYLAVFFLGKQHGETSRAKKTTKAAREEAQRYADTPVTPDDAAKRLRSRASKKRKGRDKR